MFDDVQNRRKLSLPRKLKLGVDLVRESGVVYFVLLMGYYVSAWAATRLVHALASMKAKGVPGVNSIRMNKQIWETWDWNAKGDEWTLSPAWKDSIVRSIMRPNIPGASDVLEIGPGAGRWTEHLLPIARSYVGVDISAECVRICEQRFGEFKDARFHCNSGADLAALSDRSIDRIWSFDVFVHINRAEVAQYVREMRRVMRPGALAVIHHGDHRGRTGGWRSDLTAEALVQLLVENGLSLESQVTRWVDVLTGEQHALEYEDKITVFRKPAPESS
ncbi:MAG: class I SAM-dependent methyltransferase [Betaproteobacteria bacterium]